MRRVAPEGATRRSGGTRPKGRRSEGCGHERETRRERYAMSEEASKERISLLARFRRLSPAKGRVPRLFSRVGSVPGDRSEPEERT